MKGSNQRPSPGNWYCGKERVAKYSQTHPVASAELPRNPRHDVSSRDPIPGKYLRGGSLFARTENNSSDEARGIVAASPAPCPEFVRALQVQGDLHFRV